MGWERQRHQVQSSCHGPSAHIRTAVKVNDLLRQSSLCSAGDEAECTICESRENISPFLFGAFAPVWRHLGLPFRASDDCKAGRTASGRLTVYPSDV